MKKILILLFLLSVVPSLCFAAGQVNSYTLLAPLPDLLPGDGRTVNLNGGLSTLLDTLYTAGIAIATGLAVLMITFGGIEYVTADTVGAKDGGKKKIQDALTGLILAFMSYILLNTINPDLLNNDLVLEEVKLKGATLDVSRPRSGIVYVGEAGDPSTLSPEKRAEIAESIKTGRFDKETNDYLLGLIENSQLTKLNPRDAQKFFPDGQPTAQNWANLIAGMTKAESDFNPNETYTESFSDNSGKRQISEGYLQLSRDDVANYRMKGIDPNQIRDPKVNLQMGVIILEDLVSKYGVISDYSIKTNSEGKQYREYYGGARYWSTLR